MRDALDTALRWSLVSRNAALAVDKPRVPRHEMRFMTTDEVTTFLDHVREERLFAFFLTSIFTGMRPGELYALKWEQVDLKAGTILVTHTLDSKKRARNEVKTARGRRTIAEGNPHGFVFPDPSGAALRENHISKTFQKLREAARIPYLRLYDLRHTAVTLMIAAGIHDKVISERIGHASAAFTLDTYGHVMPNMQKDAAMALDRFMPPVRSRA
jgi:integrase